MSVNSLVTASFNESLDIMPVNLHAQAAATLLRAGLLTIFKTVSVISTVATSPFTL